jgi:NAD(P)-dependent dehydrogenase (short-subunit alcohol dehydrogenase family)
MCAEVKMKPKGKVAVITGAGRGIGRATAKVRGMLHPLERAARLAVFLSSDASSGITGEIGTEAFYRNFREK